MSFKFDENLLASIASSFNYMAFLSHQSITAIETDESLSVSGQKHLNALRFCTMQASRLSNTINFLIDSGDNKSEKRTENFEIENILAEIINTFCQTISAYAPISSECRINLDNTTSILLDKARFELLFLNLLYCSVKKRIGNNKSNLKLIVSVTENKDDIVFHLRDNSSTLNPEIVAAAFSEANAKPKASKDLSFDSLILLSLKVAYKSALQMGAKLSHTPLKSGNRFDISIPKTPLFNESKVCSPIPYIPTYKLYHEILADLTLEPFFESFEKFFSMEEDPWK